MGIGGLAGWFVFDDKTPETDAQNTVVASSQEQVPKQKTELDDQVETKSTTKTPVETKTEPTEVDVPAKTPEKTTEKVKTTEKKQTKVKPKKTSETKTKTEAPVPAGPKTFGDIVIVSNCFQATDHTESRSVIEGAVAYPSREVGIF